MADALGKKILIACEESQAVTTEINGVSMSDTLVLEKSDSIDIRKRGVDWWRSNAMLFTMIWDREGELRTIPKSVIFNLLHEYQNQMELIMLKRSPELPKWAYTIHWSQAKDLMKIAQNVRVY